MSESNDLTLLQVQKQLKPKIEDVIPLIIDCNEQKNVLAFVAWLRENKLPPKWSGIHNAWDAKYKGKNFCKISLKENGQWNARLYLTNIEKYEEQIIHKKLQELIIGKLVYCRTCNPHRECGKIAMGENKQFFGEEYKGLCYEYTYMGGLMVLFQYPDEAVINGIETLLEMERDVRAKI